MFQLPCFTVDKWLEAKVTGTSRSLGDILPGSAWLRYPIPQQRLGLGRLDSWGLLGPVRAYEDLLCPFGSSPPGLGYCWSIG